MAERFLREEVNYLKLNVFVIKKHMAVQKLTAAALAQKAGMSRQNLSTILTRGTCSIISAGRIAEALAAELEEIVKEG